MTYNHDRPAVVVFGKRFLVADLDRVAEFRMVNFEDSLDTGHSDFEMTMQSLGAVHFHLYADKWELREHWTAPIPASGINVSLRSEPDPHRIAMQVIGMLRELAERYADEEALEKLEALCVFESL